MSRIPQRSQSSGGRPRKDTKRQRVSLTLLPDIRRRAEQLAFNDHRSLSSLVEQCLSREIERKGRHQTPETP